MQKTMKHDVSQIIAGYFSRQPVEKAWLFGSCSRGEDTLHSDVDILVSFTPESKVSLLDYAHMVNALQNLLSRKVDLVEDGQLCDFARESAQRDKILIYEREKENLPTLKTEISRLLAEIPD
jgi:predicted nucleotidyltransferase